MRVAVFAGYGPSLLNFRGELLRAMVSKGNEVIALAPDISFEDAAQLRKVGIQVMRIPFNRTGMNPAAELIGLVRLALTLRQIKPELLFTYTPKTIVLGTLAARIAKVPTIVAMLSGLGYAFTDGSELKRKAVRKLSRTLYRLTLPQTKLLIFQNDRDRRDLLSQGLFSAEQRCIIVPGSGVNLTRFQFSPAVPGPRFLMISRLIQDKGVREYIEAARIVKRKYPEAQFSLAGPLDPHPTAISRKLLGEWVQEGVVEYLGELSDVRPSITDAAVYVLPSYREGMPRTILEAMAIGRPVITTATAGCEETVEPGRNGILVPIQNACALAEAAEWFITHLDQIPGMGLHSRKLAEAKFGVQKINDMMLGAMHLDSRDTTQDLAC
jgi:glycosyltransferase involved in cell wall biosynthesis